jgi:hypothetical protein
MNKFTNKLEYKVIDTVQNLKDVIALLEEGYKWGNQQSKKLLSEVPKINHDYGMLGAAIYEYDSPIGAILFIYQGGISISGKNVNVVNMSSWYVKEGYRGLPAIKLQQFAVGVLRDCVITSYTTNEVASKIYYRLKFRKMNLKRAAINFNKALLGLIGVWQYRISKIKSEYIALPSNYINGFNCDRSFDYFEIKAAGKVIKLAGKVVNIRRSILGVQLTLRTFVVAYASDEKMLALLWDKIAILIMVYTQTLKLTYDFSSLNFPSGLQEKEMVCLIYGDGEIGSILPFQSELGLF